MSALQAVARSDTPEEILRREVAVNKRKMKELEKMAVAHEQEARKLRLDIADLEREAAEFEAAANMVGGKLSQQ